MGSLFLGISSDKENHTSKAEGPLSTLAGMKLTIFLVVESRCILLQCFIKATSSKRTCCQHWASPMLEQW